MVLIGHSATTLPNGLTGVLAPLVVVSDGSLGVLIFFVLSGYLITSILVKEHQETGRVSLSAFYFRRALRIFPAFYAYVLAVVALHVAGVVEISVEQLLFASLHVWNYGGLFGVLSEPAAGAIVLGHFWSLSLEEQFYWVWPAILGAVLASRQRRLLLLAALLVPLVRIGIYFAIPVQRPYLGMMFHTAIDAIAIGAAAALYQDDILRRFKFVSSPTALTAAVVALFVAVPLLRSALGGLWYATYGRTVDALLCAFLVLSLLTLKSHWFSALLRYQPVQFLGRISFSLYLWQQLFCLQGSPLALPFPFGIPIAIAIATISYYLIERPFLKIKAAGARHERSIQAAP